MHRKYTSINNKEKPSNKAVCNAFGCSKKATQISNIPVETFGTITLHLCDNCTSIFQGVNNKNNVC